MSFCVAVTEPIIQGLILFDHFFDMKLDGQPVFVTGRGRSPSSAGRQQGFDACRKTGKISCLAQPHSVALHDRFSTPPTVLRRSAIPPTPLRASPSEVLPARRQQQQIEAAMVEEHRAASRPSAPYLVSVFHG
jgi:hypothetical protein